MLGNGNGAMISEQDVAFYNENGYLVVRDVLSPSEVAELRGARTLGPALAEMEARLSKIETATVVRPIKSLTGY